MHLQLVLFNKKLVQTLNKSSNIDSCFTSNTKRMQVPSVGPSCCNYSGTDRPGQINPKSNDSTCFGINLQLPRRRNWPLNEIFFPPCLVKYNNHAKCCRFCMTRTTITDQFNWTRPRMHEVREKVVRSIDRSVAHASRAYCYFNSSLAPISQLSFAIARVSCGPILDIRSFVDR